MITRAMERKIVLGAKFNDSIHSPCSFGKTLKKANEKNDNANHQGHSGKDGKDGVRQKWQQNEPQRHLHAMDGGCIEQARDNGRPQRNVERDSFQEL